MCHNFLNKTLPPHPLSALCVTFGVSQAIGPFGLVYCTLKTLLPTVFRLPCDMGHDTKPQQSMHALLPFQAFLRPCHKTTTKHACPAASASLLPPLPQNHHRPDSATWLASYRVSPAHWHIESISCRSKYVTLLSLSIKQWEELKQEVAKILLQTVYVDARLSPTVTCC